MYELASSLAIIILKYVCFEVTLFTFLRYMNSQRWKLIVTGYTLINYMDLDSPMISSQTRVLPS